MVIDFTSITRHIQLKIISKLDVFDRIEFALSSNLGRYVDNLLLSRSVVPVDRIDFYKEDVEFVIKCPRRGKVVRKLFPKLKESLKHSLFEVNSIETWNDVSLNSVVQVCDQTEFVKNKVRIEWNTLTADKIKIFNKLTETFNISKIFSFYFNWEIAALPPILQVEFLSMKGIPADVFLNLKATSISCEKIGSDLPIGPILNKFFQQWLRKSRKIDWLKVEIIFHDEPGSEAILNDIPTRVEWKDPSVKVGQAKIDFLNDVVCTHSLGAKDAVYSIARDDGNTLLVFISVSNNRLIAKEFDDLEKAIKITLT